MDIDIAIPHVGSKASRANIEAVARGAEEMGCRTLWTLERLIRPVKSQMPASYGLVYEPIESLTWAAAKTERIRFGTSVIDALYHVPAHLARRFATLDQLSGGRVTIGLGQGNAPEEFQAANVPMKRRGAGFEEFIGALLAAWGPDPVSYKGRFYQIPESQIGPKPVQRPHPPLLFGARPDSLVSIERAARLADGFNPTSGQNWEMLEKSIVSYKEAVAKAGRDLGKMQIVIRANTAITPKRLDEPRNPMRGSREQVLDDLHRAERLGTTEVFFDFNAIDLEPREQLGIIRDLRSAS